jgi:hypothetical protein
MEPAWPGLSYDERFEKGVWAVGVEPDCAAVRLTAGEGVETLYKFLTNSDDGNHKKTRR